MAETQPTILFRDDVTGQVMLFAEPAEIIVARTRAEFFAGLARMEQAKAAGKWLAGYMAYEAGYLFEEKLAPFAREHRDTPLICFGVFDAPQPDTHPLAQPKQRLENEEFLTAPKAAWDFPIYKERFDRLHKHLRLGDAYQANLTMPVEARWNGDPRAAFWSLIERQPVKYGALVDLGGPIILSRSPELFFRTDEQGWIETHPMKGTAKRGTTAAEDAEIIEAMRSDIKTQAENRMIVDLLRNDISRITEVGTLDVPKLFDIETYPTVHQMVSHVQARLRPDLSIRDIFSALFPCGSITGAPKMRAMEILHALEDAPRDAYCGAIGMISPTGAMRFSVAIRTITLFEGGRAVFNVGGGIVFDSTAEAEYEECLLKARFAVGDQWIAR
ncbi:aminodeoxychorismate synthase component I [Rhizobium ruizarguesonis]|jgi:para-aminobenzoate synthetase component 1|uniref:Aminodeoxychorismate synthase component I n=1 Tax=Rhizobium ruizarguesonis TaxID=2081791 RepID=A0AAE4YPE6_9HYPH|nr:aminodeoxychorismate synthase component I [Rhizobium ruizarguesonis]MBY5895168.1 aminodeoxychorismate synthase component I [Rhizobium leguminosarum]NKL14194.1 aminodeoxychorismate synthase component I [Rhizobium leguminosarum bv. viciae]QIO46369.1 aminodeoxychorismate synthase component I [Rhizobium leguminosarum bv. trifolii]MCB2401582.1 aminodeoxychorismate synthase component I [Rhizobium ruizarguesonis]NEI48406.1 aminodeoxychorismate synthase component I [Rhizobium ruizarguesonis]